MLKFLRKHLTGVDGDPYAEPMVTCTVKQLRNAITYAVSKLQPARADEEFRKAYAFARDDVPGMAWLSVNGRVDQVRLAHHRLTLAARHQRARGDERTIDQLKADLALDLLIGKQDAAPVPTYARPITNLTVPIQTVMGLSDDPGVLSGGTVVDGFQLSGTELREAVEGLGDWDDLMRRRAPEINWEDDFDEGLTESEWAAVWGRQPVA
jgi:hypothetical protein